MVSHFIGFRDFWLSWLACYDSLARTMYTLTLWCQVTIWWLYKAVFFSPLFMTFQNHSNLSVSYASYNTIQGLHLGACSTKWLACQPLQTFKPTFLAVTQLWLQHNTWMSFCVSIPLCAPQDDHFNSKTIIVFELKLSSHTNAQVST